MKSAKVKLGDACEFIRGVTFPGGEAEVKPFAGAIACLTTSGVQREVAWKSRRFIPRERVGKDSQLLRAGDILISTANSKELVGKSCLVHRTPFDCTFGAFVTGVRPAKSVFPSYLAFWMTTPEFLGWCYQISTNTTNISNLRVSELEELEISLPPLSEQQRIAGLLGQADRLRRTRRYALELSDSFLPAAFLELFGDPAKKSQWPLVPFGELIAVGPQNGLYKPASAYGSGTPIVRIDAYQSGEVVDFAALKRVRVSPDEIETYGLAAGDFLINRVNSRSHLGKSTLVPKLSEPTVFESNMMRFRVNESVLVPAYALKFLQTRFFNAQIQKQAKDASNQSSINQSDVEGFAIFLPSLSLQQQFAALVERHEHLRATQREAFRQAEHLFQTLLHRAFSEGA